MPGTSKWTSRAALFVGSMVLRESLLALARRETARLNAGMEVMRQPAAAAPRLSERRKHEGEQWRWKRGALLHKRCDGQRSDA